METWRCNGCGRIILELEVSGGAFLRHKCHCNTWNTWKQTANFIAVTSGNFVGYLEPTPSTFLLSRF